MSPLRRRSRTLRGRVSALAVAVIAGWLVVLALGFDLVIASRIDTQVDDALRVRAQAASATVIVTDGRVSGVRESATDGQLDSSIWVYGGTHAYARPDVATSKQHSADGLAEAPAGYRDAHDERFYVLPVEYRGTRIGSVISGIDREPYDHTRDIVVVGSIVVVALLAIGAYPILTRTTSRALQPVARMTDQAAEWSVHSPNERFGHDQQYAELNSLAVTLDELLDRLSAVLRHERQLSAELSHELRTPLARVSAEVDLMVDDARPDQLPALTSIRASCTSMDHIIDTLLAAARSELVPTVGRCALDPVLRSLAEADPRIRVEPTRLTVGVGDELVTRMLAPVVENARRYARTEVAISARRVPGGAEVVVTNDGPVLPDEHVERVFEPGFRGDGPDDGHPGAGLGLPLARRLARAADGDLVAVPGTSRTTFRLTLPAG